MIVKQIYDKIFSYALSGADSWEKSLIDDVLEEDGLLDKEDGISNNNSDDVADAVLSLADIALSLIDKGKIGTSVSRNLYSNLRKSTSKETKKEAVKDTVSETSKRALKKETKELTKNVTEKTIEVTNEIAKYNSEKNKETKNSILNSVKNIKSSAAEITQNNNISKENNNLNINLPKTKYTMRKLQHEYKHSKDFGINGNWNVNNAKLYQMAIQNHIDTAPEIYKSKYRGQDVYVYFNQKTLIGTYTDMDGNYIGGWKFNYNQINYHLTNSIKIK